MARRRAVFAIVYDHQVKKHLGAIDRKYHSLIRGSIEQQLTYEPHIETRNRKLLSRPAGLDAEWELRLGASNRFRVFYAIDLVRREVQVLAIGVKQGSRLFIAGEEITL